jgi:hypothetical protein
MKRLFSLLSLAGLLAGLFATTGCEIRERGGYYGPHEYDYGHGGDHDRGYWDRGHYHHDYD